MNPAEKIPFLHGYDEIRPILDGYSSDQKYLVLKDGKGYLLRTFPAATYLARQKEFDVLSKMAECEVLCSRPIEMDRSDGLGYMLLTFIEGIDGGKALPALPETDQYRIGVQAGQELKKIHCCLAPPEVSPWHQRKLAKHERYLEQYRNGDTKFKNDAKVMAYIADHLHLMKDRPNLFQHDDFHIRNLIVADRRLAGVIDFNRYDWGDPIHEFLKVGQFSTEVSVPFSVGQIKGYFDGKDPDAIFWRLYSLYSAMSLFSFVVWTKHVCPEEIPKTMAIINRVLTDHDYFEHVEPRWYSEQSLHGQAKSY